MSHYIETNEPITIKVMIDDAINHAIIQLIDETGEYTYVIVPEYTAGMDNEIKDWIENTYHDRCYQSDSFTAPHVRFTAKGV